MNPLQIMDEIERRYTADKGLPILVSPGDWQSLRTATEARAEELAQKNALIARLEGALQKIVDETPANQHEKWHHHHFYLVTAREALNESEPQSLAAVKAEALLGLLEALDPKTESQCEMIADIGRYIDRIERETKEES